MDREAVSRRIQALAPRITQREWYGKTYRQFWHWFGAETRAIEDEAEATTDEEKEWLAAEMLPLHIDTDEGGFTFPHAGYSSVIQPWNFDKTFEEQLGIQEAVVRAFEDFRSESPPEFWSGRTYGDYWKWFVGREGAIRGMARIPGEREKIDAELKDIRETYVRWGGIQGDEPDSNVIP